MTVAIGALQSTGQFRFAAPAFCVADAQPMIAYMTQRLGFQLENSVGDPPVWASLIRGRVEIMLLKRDGPAPVQDWAAYIYVDDADALHAEFTASGADIVRPPEDRPYNNREFEVRLPDGRMLAFGGPIPN